MVQINFGVDFLCYLGNEIVNSFKKNAPFLFFLKFTGLGWIKYLNSVPKLSC